MTYLGQIKAAELVYADDGLLRAAAMICRDVDLDLTSKWRSSRRI